MFKNATPYLRALVEALYRATFKAYFLQSAPPLCAVADECRFGRQLVLPPYLGEMGMGIRHHLAKVEPYLRSGWKILSRKPAFYPKGTAIYNQVYFAAQDEIVRQYEIVGSEGGVYIPPAEYGHYGVRQKIDGEKGEISVSFTNCQKAMAQACAEVELRKLFVEWFCFKGRPVTEYDHETLSFSATTVGNVHYRLAAALRPGYLPDDFLTPREPAPSHVGVQIRNVVNTVNQPRNSDPEWMLKTAAELARHFGVDLLVYGHPDGCVIPSGYRTSWDPSRPGNHLERELGYLKSCRMMLSPDSGWTDLMAWLGIPVLLEKKPVDPKVYEPLRYGFRPKIQVVDRSNPIGVQADALLASMQTVLPEGIDPRPDPTPMFPWLP